MLLLIGWLSSQKFEVFGQFVPQSSLYMQDKYGINPAYGGMERSLAAGIHYRTQWVGLPGNPEFRSINAHLPMYILNGGVGLQVHNESIGAEKQTSFSLSYNYVTQTTFGTISAGLRGGLLTASLDGTILQSPDGNYEGGIIDHLDGNLPNGRVSGISPLMEAGIFFSGSQVEAGVSMSGYLPGGIQLGDGIHFKPAPATHFFGEYRINTSSLISIIPGAYIKTDFRQTQVETYVRATWNQVVHGLIGYRGFSNQSRDAVLISIGVKLSPKFTLYYGYDINVSSLSTAHEGTHEIMLRYNLGKTIGAGLPPPVIYNPRNL